MRHASPLAPLPPPLPPSIDPSIPPPSTHFSPSAAYANEGFSSFAHNWVAALQALGIDEFVIAALDEGIRGQLAQRGVESHVLYFEPQPLPPPVAGKTHGTSNASSPLADRSRAVTWYDQGYRQLMGTQPSRVLRIMQAGHFDLLVSDVDVLWRRSPWGVLYSPSRAHCQVQAIKAHHVGNAPANASDASVVIQEPHPQVASPFLSSFPEGALAHALASQANCANCINAGFIFFRRGKSSMELVRRWEHALQALKRTSSHRISAAALGTIG